MRMTVILLTVALLQVSAKAVSQKVSFKGQHVSLQKVFTVIEEQTGFVVFYDYTAIKTAKTVTLNTKETPLDEFLKLTFKDQPFHYVIEGKTILVSARPIQPISSGDGLSLSPLPPPPPIDISGKITDKEGNPLSGASVKVKGTNKGTTTAADGVFVLKGVEGNAVLEISFVGYEATTVAVNNKTTVTTSLNAVAASLQDVIVSKGYYSVKQRENTGNVSIVSAKEIGEQPVSDPIQALIGRVPGLNIQQQSGIPGAYAKINIRGQNSIANGNDPLYIVDGVPFSSKSLTLAPGGGGALGVPSSAIASGVGAGMSPFGALSPSDIESIEVLKDADATAIYGSRGANGVILITTKKGKAGDTKFNFESSEGIGQVGHFMDLLNTQQYLQMRREAFKNDGLLTSSSQYSTAYDVNGFWDTTRYTDLQKVLIGNTAQYTNIQGNISGGNANTQFALGAGYNRQTTVYPGDYGDKKGSIHLNLMHTSPNQKFRVQFTTNYVIDNNNIPQTDFAGSILLPPDVPALYKPNGDINWQILNATVTFFNPIASTLKQATAVTNNLISNLSLNYQIIPGLQLKSSLGYNHDQMDQSILTPAASQQPPNNSDPGYRSNYFGTTDFQTWIIEPQLSYERKIAKGQLSVLIGTTLQQNIQKSRGENASGFASDDLINNPKAASTFSLNYNNYTLYRYNAIYGRIGYNWDDKYLINLTARRDGSSRFGPSNQFGNFGAIGAGWIFTKEKLIDDNLPWLSFGKLRISYGTTGNDQMTDYQFLSTYNSVSSTYQGITGLTPTGLTNPYFGWEEVKKMEAGLELGFLKDRINLDVSYYRNRTVNQLVGEPLASITGFTTVQFNLPAIIQNAGLEFNLNTVNIKTTDFNWTTSANLTLPNNKLVAFDNIENFSAYKGKYIVGQSLYIRRLPGLVGVDPQIGKYIYNTQNTNGIPTNPTEYVTTSPFTQKFYGGLRNSFTYKGFSLDIFIQFVRQLGNGYLSNISRPGGSNNVPTEVLSRWQAPGDMTALARFSTYLTSNNPDPNNLLKGSDAIITDASFIRLKNVALSYSLPKHLQQWAHIQNARIFIQGQNLLTITKYIGLDPETQGLTVPPLRMIALGISASF